MSKRPRGGASVPCPRCGGPSRVVETRRLDPMRTVHRKRKCVDNNHSFESEEVAVPGSHLQSNRRKK